MMSKSTVLLSIDTSIGPCSVAISRGAEILAYAHIEDFHQQSKQLVPLCESALKVAGLTYQDMDGVCATVGPGSFTSIRVGMATAKATAFALSKPYYGVSTLQVIASAHTNSTIPILAAFDAHRGEAYVQLFNADVTSVGEPEALPYAELLSKYTQSELMVVGNAAPKIKELLSGMTSWKFSQENVPDARKVSAFVNANIGKNESVFSASPIYIRPPDAKIPVSQFS